VIIDPEPVARPRSSPLVNGTLGVIVAIVTSIFVLFMVAPLGGLVAAGGPSGLRSLATDDELRSSLALTFASATVATILGIVGGTPLAYYLARRPSRLASVVSTVIELPLVIPHPVAGIALLLVLGRQSAIGGPLFEMGLRIVGSWQGIVCAMLLVSAPLYVAASREAFARVDPRYEGVARTLGDSAWTALRRVTLPLAGRGLLAASVVMWARAISEFGAIVILTYNPKVASVLSYDRFTSYGLSEALPVAAVLVIVALVPLIAIRMLAAPSLPSRANEGGE
jgi:molybdate/tungstate transport system permease protein